MNKLRLYLRLSRLAAVLGVGALLATFLVPVERLTRRDLLGLRQRLTRWFLARLGNALPFRVSVRGQLPQKPMLWLSNHISWTDIPLIGMLAPLSFLSKAEVRTWPLAGWLPVGWRTRPAPCSSAAAPVTAGCSTSNWVVI